MKKEYYECFSPPLMRFLLNRNISPEKITAHNVTGYRMWIYKQSPELSMALREYSKRKREYSNSKDNGEK